jgi:hypothetical protein
MIERGNKNKDLDLVGLWEKCLINLYRSKLMRQTIFYNVARYSTSNCGTTQWHCFLHKFAVQKIKK